MPIVRQAALSSYAVSKISNIMGQRQLFKTKKLKFLILRDLLLQNQSQKQLTVRHYLQYTMERKDQSSKW